MNSKVVVKVLTDESYRDDYLKKKFRQEIEALVRLNHPGHPGVIQVFDQGEMPDGKPYFVMQFVDGNNLRSEIRVNPKGMGFKRVANIVEKIGRALNYTHERGVYHRDLNPKNIMLQIVGESEEIIKLIDFGIAKIFDSQIAENAERSKVAGTLAYMAPEQLIDGETSSASDIYAMGVIAYQMITGQLPFKANSETKLFQMQKVGEFSKPKALRCELPDAAQAVILKALSFDEKDRYVRARDFGEELARALMTMTVTQPDKPVEKPSQSVITLSPQKQKLTERPLTTKKPVALPERKEPDSNASLPSGNRWAWAAVASAALASIAIALRLWTEMQSAAWLGLAFGLAAIVCGSVGLRTGKREKRAAISVLVIGVIAVAASLWLTFLTSQTIDYAKAVSLKTLTRHGAAVTSITFSLDSRTIASGSADKTIMLWDARTGRLNHTLQRHSDTVQAVAFSPDGRLLASGGADFNVMFWDAQTGEWKRSIKLRGQVNSIAFSPDGKTLACGLNDSTVQLWDVASGALNKTMDRHSGPVNSVAFSPDGSTLASGSADFAVILWDAQNGEMKRPLKHRDQVNSVAFSPDGKTLVSGAGGKDNAVRLWDTRTGELKQTLTGHGDWVYSVAFSPDGKTVASTSKDNSVRLWGVSVSSTQYAEIKKLEHAQTGQSNPVSAVAFSPNGKLLMSAGGDGTVILWGAK